VEAVYQRTEYNDRAGILTWLLYRLLLDVLTPRKYRDYALVLGCVDSASKEFYRRRIAPYEDKKIHENGDVDPLIADYIP